MKYCKFCGKELKKGEICSCKSERKEENQRKKEMKDATETIKKEVSKTSKKYFQDFLELLKNMFYNPKKTFEKFLSQEDKIMSLCILIFSSIFLALGSIFFLNGIYPNLSKISWIYPSSVIWKFSYFRILSSIFLGVLLGYFLLAIIFNLGLEKISQTKITFQSTLSVIAISVLEPTFLGMLASFMTIFSYKLAFLFLCYAILLFVFNLYQTFSYVIKTEANYYNRLFVLLILAFYFLAIYLIPNLLL